MSHESRLSACELRQGGAALRTQNVPINICVGTPDEQLQSDSVSPPRCEADDGGNGDLPADDAQLVRRASATHFSGASQDRDEVDSSLIQPVGYQAPVPIIRFLTPGPAVRVRRACA